MPSTAVQSATRVLRVIEALNRRSVTSVSELHAVTALPKSTLVRLLETLVAAGYVTRVSRRDGYALTEAILGLSAGVRTRDLVVDVARPLMERFTGQHRWQVSMAISETDCMIVRFTTRHISPFARQEIFLNRRVTMLRSALGRAYFAACQPDEQAFILKVLADSDPAQIEEAGGDAAIAAMVAEVRRKGYGTADWPAAEPTRSFALPILDRDTPGRPLGSVVMFYYRSVMTEAVATRRYLPAVQELAEQIAAGLQTSRAAHATP